MATRDVLRRRLQSTETLRSVVQTMKALATVRIGQVRRAVAALDASAATLELAFGVLLRHRPDLASFAPQRRSTAVGAVAFGSDHGLCGPFNERLARHAAEVLAGIATADPTPSLMVAGRRLRPRLARLGHEPERVVHLPANVDAIEDAVVEVVDQIEAWQEERAIDRVFVIHHQPTSGIGYRPRTVQLLPLDAAWLNELRERPWPSPRLPMVGLGEERMLRALVRQYLAHVLVRAFAASQAAENAARLAAMEAAERNVDERLTELRHAANLERQNAVTAELLDVQAAYLAAGG
jgi:F-type H+-transporting ATPase subunit gamma